MSAFTRQQKRFVAKGISLTTAKDNLPPGKFSGLQNVRSYIQGTVQAREGVLLKGNVTNAPLHSVYQMEDSSPGGGNGSTRFVGAGADLFAGPINGPWNEIDSGYSGNPLTFAVATPPQSPQPWLYVVDSSRMRKMTIAATPVPIGIAPPVLEPEVTLDALPFNVIQHFSGAVPWMSVGTQAAAMTTVFSGRISTSAEVVLYDEGTNGNCCIVPVLIEGFDDGILVDFNAGAELVAVQQVTIAVADTTVEAIIYDAGTTGLCTIQPAGSLGVGQLNAPTQSYYEDRVNTFYRFPGQTVTINSVLQAEDRSLPGVPVVSTGSPTTQIRQIDFPVNAVVQVGGEPVRIISVALGADGVQSFRCKTVVQRNAGDSIVGLPAFRAYTQGHFTPGTTITDGYVQNVITPIVPAGQTTGKATGGVSTTPTYAGVNLALIQGRATLPSDDFHCSVRIDQLAAVTAVRVYLDVDETTNNFEQNYFFFEWSANDIIAAIQSQNTEDTATLQQTRLTTVTTTQLNQPFPSDVQVTLPGASGSATPTSSNTNPGPGQGVAASAVPSTLGLGNNQWLELRCKIGDLLRVGNETSRTLANVKAAEILVAIDWNQAVTIAYDALWVSGGFEPDVGSIGAPYVYRARYRSSNTGSKSNLSPASRGGVIARRQRVFTRIGESPDGQADLVDWFRFGGGLVRWTYVGTTVRGQDFNDVYGDGAVNGGEVPTEQDFQPWPTLDLSRNGTCNVAGSAIQWVSGDQFNTQWAPGSLIVVNGRTCSLYSQPPSSTFLFVNENAGSAAGAEFSLAAPTLMARNFPTWWGGPIGGATFYFSTDTVNPGWVHWTNGNDSETASDSNQLEISPAAEPLQNGFMYDGTSFVASTDQIYALVADLGSTPPFRPQITPCGKGFWTRWAFALGTKGIYFLAKDGIYLTSGGGPAQSITDVDLYPLFPHDGVLGQAVNGVLPVDMTQASRLRLTWVEGWLYFDYVDTGGAPRSLCFREADGTWWPDYYDLPGGPGVMTRYAVQGLTQNVEVLAGVNGNLYTGNGGDNTDGGGALLATMQWVDDQGDARRQKLYRDLMLDVDLGGGTATVSLSVDNGSTNIRTQVIGPAATRGEQFIDSTLETGDFGQNLQVDVSWNPASVPKPIFYVWDIAYQNTPEKATSWLSGPTTHGFSQWQQVYQALFTYRSQGPVVFSLIVDGVVYTYNLPTTGGLVLKKLAILQSVKGKVFQYGFQGPAFQLFDKETEVWVQPWGVPGGYQKVSPF